jgi:preprotein translocase SecE subunit
MGLVMAVAIKNTPEVESPTRLDRMPVVALAGTAYLLGTLGIVFYLLPSLWETINWSGNASAMVRGLVQLAALSGLLLFGARLLGPNAAHGVRAGIFVSFVGFLLILLLTRWASLWIEYGSFYRGWFGPSTGATLTAVIGLALLLLGIRLFLRSATERFLIRFEDQGWFIARPYKAMQGLRVRRGTIFGILLLAGAGIWTMLAHGTLRKGERDWRLNVPFTGKVVLESKGDVPDAVMTQYLPDWETRLADHTLIVDRFTLREINESVNPSKYVKVLEPGSSSILKTNDVVERGKYKEEEQKLSQSGETVPQVGVPEPATGPLMYRSLTLLPALQFTVPLLLAAAALWLAWRIVNVPAFADFLIATEAEVNKVSWTTQRRLVQDTIVVLVTVVLMAFYLFSMDVVWKSVLSWPPIGVLKISEKQDATQPVEDRPW